MGHDAQAASRQLGEGVLARVPSPALGPACADAGAQGSLLGEHFMLEPCGGLVDDGSCATPAEATSSSQDGHRVELKKETLRRTVPVHLRGPCVFWDKYVRSSLPSMSSLDTIGSDTTVTEVAPSEGPRESRWEPEMLPSEAASKWVRRAAMGDPSGFRRVSYNEYEDDGNYRMEEMIAGDWSELKRIACAYRNELTSSAGKSKLDLPACKMARGDPVRPLVKIYDAWLDCLAAGLSQDHVACATSTASVAGSTEHAPGRPRRHVDIAHELVDFDSSAFFKNPLSCLNPSTISLVRFVVAPCLVSAPSAGDGDDNDSDISGDHFVDGDDDSCPSGGDARVLVSSSDGDAGDMPGMDDDSDDEGGAKPRPKSEPTFHLPETPAHPVNRKSPEEILKRHHAWVLANSGARVTVHWLLFGKSVFELETTLLYAAALVLTAHEQLGHVRHGSTLDALVNSMFSFVSDAFDRRTNIATCLCDYVRASCKVCRDASQGTHRATPKSTLRTGPPGAMVVHVDTLDLTTKYKWSVGGGRQYIQSRVCVWYDKHGRVCMAEPSASFLPDKHAGHAREALVKSGVLGFAHTLHLDRGSEFYAGDCLEMIARLHPSLAIRQTPRGVSQSNGIVERFNQSILKGFRLARHLGAGVKEKPDGCLVRIVRDVARLMMARYLSPDEAMGRHRIDVHSDGLAAAADDAAGWKARFQVGQEVEVFVKQLKGGKKLQARWVASRVETVMGPHTYFVRHNDVVPNTGIRFQKVHERQMRAVVLPTLVTSIAPAGSDVPDDSLFVLPVLMHGSRMSLGSTSALDAPAVVCSAPGATQLTGVHMGLKDMHEKVCAPSAGTPFHAPEQTAGTHSRMSVGAPTAGQLWIVRQLETDSTSLPFSVVEIPQHFHRLHNPFVYLLLEVGASVLDVPSDHREASNGPQTRLERVRKGAQGHDWVVGVKDGCRTYVRVPVHGLHFWRRVHPATVCSISGAGAYWVPRSQVHEALTLLADTRAKLIASDSAASASSGSAPSELAWEPDDSSVITHVMSCMAVAYADAYNACPPVQTSDMLDKPAEPWPQRFSTWIKGLSPFRTSACLSSWDADPELIDEHTACMYARSEMDARLLGAACDPVREACMADIHARALRAAHGSRARAPDGQLPPFTAVVTTALAAVPDDDPVVYLEQALGAGTAVAPALPLGDLYCDPVLHRYLWQAQRKGHLRTHSCLFEQEGRWLPAVLARGLRMEQLIKQYVELGPIRRSALLRVHWLRQQQQHSNAWCVDPLAEPLERLAQSFVVSALREHNREVDELDEQASAVPGIVVCVALPDEQVVEGLTTQEKQVKLTTLTPAQWEMLWRAVAAELRSFIKNKVLEPVPAQECNDHLRPEGLNPLPMRFVFEWRLIDGIKQMKARLVAQGTKQKDRRTNVETAVALPPLRVLRVLLAYQVARSDWDPTKSVMQADLKTAYLQAPNRSPLVYCTCPKFLRTSEDAEVQALVAQLFGPQGHARVKQSLYGTRDAGANLDVHVRGQMGTCGFVECLTCANLYFRMTASGSRYSDFVKWKDDPTDARFIEWQVAGAVYTLDCWVYIYVDDLLAGGGETCALDALNETCAQAKLQLKDPPKVPERFTGISFTLTEAGVYWDQHALAESLAVDVREGPEIDCPPLSDAGGFEAFQKDMRAAYDAGDVLDEKAHSAYRSLLGSLAYLHHTHPHLLFLISLMGRYSAAPTTVAWYMLLDIARFAKSYAQWGLAIEKEFPQRMAVVLERSGVPTCPSGSLLPLAPIEVSVAGERTWGVAL